MNILFLNHNIKGVGTYIRCFNFAKHLVRFGHSVVILTSAPSYILTPKREMHEGVEVVCMPDVFGRRLRNGGLGIIDTALRCLYIQRRHFDIVENFDHRPAVLYPALMSRYLQKTHLVSEWTDLHGTGGSLENRPECLQKLIRPYEDFTEKTSKKIAKKLIVISRGLRNMALKLGVPESRIVRIPGGADVENILPGSRIEIRKRLGLPVDKKIIAYTAGTHYDIELLIKTVNIIQKKRKDVVLVTTGASLVKKYRRKLFDTERIIELGFLPYDRYTDFLPSADVFIFPYVNSTLNIGRWPNKIGDYMAAGRPVVSNPTGDITELFEKHEIGLLASEDPNDFADKTLTLLDDSQLNARMGLNARKIAEQQYDWKILSGRLEDCFREIMLDDPTR
ncbi:MAG: glycosyltransferase family 4 protein [Desulfobacterales bacterium]|nr:glycosyltransferase family 4 protein [Desulfobacterales bacterium]MDD4072124.1 glycosyltransferase family 4 protein [Desulfobacterales bacterium]MDD4392760.1 glycosyltransferase family 4 protein [Desulfobacterales bacterium]